MATSHKRHVKIPLLFLFFVSIICLFLGTRIVLSYRMRQWDHAGNFIVLESHTLALTVFKPQQEEINTFLLPKDAYIKVIGGYGFYKLKDIISLSKSEGKGESLVLTSVAAALGVPIDASYSTLQEWDRLSLWHARKTYKKTDVVLSLEDAPIFREETRPDGVVIQKIDSQSVDKYLKQRLWEREITGENLTIGIFNASDSPGVASFIGRKIENIGGRVIEIANWNGEEGEAGQFTGKCQIRVQSKYLQSGTLSRLSKIFPCPISDAPLSPRFDIAIIASEIL